MYATRKRWPVFPVAPRSKKPLLSYAAGGNGVHDATLDPGKINEWWQAHPTDNIGIACGRPSGFFVVDVDPRHDGDESLAELEKAHGPLPPTPRQLTGGGGEHILFKIVAGIANKSGFLGPGLDIKATGGYIVGSPSIQECGRAYSWNVDLHPLEVPIADAPEWLLKRLRGPKASNGEHDRQPTPLDEWAALISRPIPGLPNRSLNR